MDGHKLLRILILAVINSGYLLSRKVTGFVRHLTFQTKDSRNQSHGKLLIDIKSLHNKVYTFVYSITYLFQGKTIQRNWKFSLSFIPDSFFIKVCVPAMKTCGGVGVLLHSFLNRILERSECSVSTFLTPEKEPLVYTDYEPTVSADDTGKK